MADAGQLTQLAEPVQVGVVLLVFLADLGMRVGHGFHMTGFES